MRKLLFHSYVLIVMIFVSEIKAQIHGQIPIKSFDHKNFNGGDNSNLSIALDNQGYLYSGNFKGFQKYNGTSWSLSDQFDKTLTYIQYSQEYNLLFYGSADDLGYFKPNPNGDLVTYSLDSLANLDSYIVWQIFESDGCVFFGTTKGNLIWNGQSFQLDNSRGLSEVSGQLFAPTGNNLVKFENCQPKVILENIKPTARNRTVSGTTDSLVVLDETKEGFLILRDQVKPLQSTFDFQPGLIYKTFEFNEIQALTYVNSGVQFIPKNGKVWTFNSKNGISGDFIRDVERDKQTSFWLASPQGIDKIDLYSPVQTLDIELDGLPLAITTKDDKLFIGTSTDLYSIIKGHQAYNMNDFIRTITPTSSKILLLSGRNGIWSLDIESEKLSRLSDIKLTSIIIEINDDEFIIGDQIEISTYKLENSRLNKGVSILNGANAYDASYYSDSILWVASKSKGLYKWDLRANEINLYDQNSGLKSPAYTYPFKFQQSIYTFDKKSLYKFNPDQNVFNKVFDYYQPIDFIQELSSGTFIIVSKNEFNDIILDEVRLVEDGYEIVSKKFNAYDFSPINDIHYDSVNNHVWFATSENVVKYDLSIESNENLDFNTAITQVSSLDSVLFHGHFGEMVDGIMRFTDHQTTDFIPTLSYENNAIKFEYGALYFHLNDKIKFQYYLEGNEENWSKYTKERVKEYNNLSPGTYTFHVKATNIYDMEGQTASYTFKILPPWYMTTWAYVMFSIGGGLFIWFLVLGYSYRVRLQRRKLKLIVADRTFEVLSQKKEIEKQNQMLKEQFEEIEQQRDSINEKNQELEMTQEEIMSINDRLQELNASLEKKVDERTEEIKSTVKKLQQTVIELDTFIYRASHDLKGPISRINGLTSLAKLEATNENDLKYYDLIDSVARDMNKLLAKLTQVHEVINCNVEPEAVDLPVLISEVRNSIKFLDKVGTTKYAFDLQDCLEVVADPFLMAIIFTNLLENALIFKKHGQKDHLVKISAKKTADQYIIVFEDNGSGIPAEHIEKVFNMFYRGSDQSKGSGLGLYLTKMSLEKMKGEIMVESEFSKYTKITLHIPRVNIN